jgi:hypothetical protein
MAKRILHQKIIKIMTSAEKRISCKDTLNAFNNIPIAGKFLLLLLVPAVVNMEIFQTNADTHNVRTRQRHNHIYVPKSNMGKY